MNSRNNGRQSEPGRQVPESALQKAEELMEPPAWLAALRNAVAGAIKAEDIGTIMQMQVEKAKAGDTRAVKFVLDQAHQLMQSDQRKIVVTQNNFYDSTSPEKTITPETAKDDELRILRMRARCGLPTTGLEGDKRFRPISDEEEKEMRRREEEEP